MPFTSTSTGYSTGLTVDSSNARVTAASGEADGTAAAMKMEELRAAAAAASDFWVVTPGALVGATYVSKTVAYLQVPAKVSDSVVTGASIGAGVSCAANACSADIDDRENDGGDRASEYRRI